MINWKLRLKNKATLLSLAVLVISFVYQVLGLFGIVPGVSQDAIVQIVTLIINALAMFGVVVDPTTAGVSDSQKAMTYEEPKKEVSK